MFHPLGRGDEGSIQDGLFPFLLHDVLPFLCQALHAFAPLADRPLAEGPANSLQVPPLALAPSVRTIFLEADAELVTITLQHYGPCDRVDHLKVNVELGARCRGEDPEERRATGTTVVRRDRLRIEASAER